MSLINILNKALQIENPIKRYFLTWLAIATMFVFVGACIIFFMTIAYLCTPVLGTLFLVIAGISAVAALVAFS